MPQDFWSNAIFSITPTILVGLIFWFAMRAIIRADRTERAAYSKIEAEERARFESGDLSARAVKERASEVTREG